MTTFRPKFERLRDQLAVDFPAYSFEVWSSPTGSLTSYQGYDLGIECLFPDAAPAESNCVSASVGVRHLTTTPEICDFEVSWCQGASPEASIQLLVEPVSLSRETIQGLVTQFPKLETNFRTAVGAWATCGKLA